MAALAAAHDGLTSSRAQAYISVNLRFGDEPAASVSDSPLVLATQVGDLTHFEVDLAALALLSGMDSGDAPAVPTGMPVEMIFDEAGRQVFVKLAPLLAGDPATQPAWLDEVAAERGVAAGDLWGRESLAGAQFVQGLSPSTQPSQEDMVELLQAALANGSVLSANAAGAGEVGGVATQTYTFTVDLAAMAESWPGFLSGPLGGTVGGAGDPEGFLSGPLPATIALHIDAQNIVRRAMFEVDLGAMLTEVMGAFGEMGDPDGEGGAAPEMPGIEYSVAFRVDTLAVNDPSLSVTLPDPSLVVDMIDAAPPG